MTVAPRLRILLATAALLGSCASSQWFRPRHNVTGEGPDGNPAGEYELRVSETRIGTIRVWSDGARPDRSVTELHVGLEFENLGDRPIRLPSDPVIANLVAGTARDVQFSPARRAGELTAAPNEITAIDFWYRLDGISPWEIQSFDVRWVARIDGQPVETTVPFAPDDRSRYADYMAVRADENRPR